MPEGQGYSHGNGKMTGTTKSTSSSAPMENKGGNYGKPMGDTGKKSPKGNRMTKVPADRYTG